MYCLALLDPSQRNWFHKSQLTSMVEIALWRPCAKTKVDESCTCTYDVYLLVDEPGTWNGFQDQNTEQWLNNNPTIIEQYCSKNQKLTEKGIWMEYLNKQKKRVQLTWNAKHTINAQYTIHMNSPKKTLKGKFAKSQRYCPNWAHSDQMVLRPVGLEAGSRDRQSKALKLS